MNFNKLLRLCSPALLGMVLLACGQKSGLPPPSPAAPTAKAEAASAPTLAMARAKGPAQDQAGDAPEEGLRRYLAVRHQISLQTDAERLREIYDQILRQCSAPACEVLNANFAIETEGNLPSASMELRMQPSKSEAFITQLSTQAQLIGHQRSSDDRTDQVIDTEARLKNLSDLRERLRSLLNERKGSLKELLDVQRELAETQAKLDAAASMRKVLANETEKVAFGITLQAKRAPLNKQLWTPLQEAWNNSGHTLVESLAWMLSAAIALLPFLVALAVLLGVWAKSKARRRVKQSQS